jgi:hypothetical protein
MINFARKRIEGGGGGGGGVQGICVKQVILRHPKDLREFFKVGGHQVRLGRLLGLHGQCVNVFNGAVAGNKKEKEKERQREMRNEQRV